MDDQRARELISVERTRVEALLAETTAAGTSDRSEENTSVNIDDSAEPLTAEGTENAVTVGLRTRLDALDRAEQRVDAGTFGRSVRSGRPIPDERLEADPAAELTIDEATQPTTMFGTAAEGNSTR